MEESMMSSLDLGKSIDDIEAPVLLPEGWYEMEVASPAPSVMPNAAKAQDPADPKAGDNWVIRLKTVHPEAQYSGRRFTLWLGVPKEADREAYTQDGQKIYDAKMQRIVDFVLAFGGTAEGSQVTLNVGSQGRCYILQQINRLSGELENQIDIFNAGFKKVESDDPLL